MADTGNVVNRGSNSGNVRAGRERREPDAVPAGRVGQAALEVVEVQSAVSRQLDDDRIDEGFPPHELVGVMLVGSDEDYRLGQGRRRGYVRPGAARGFAQAVQPLPGDRGNVDADDLLKLLEGSGRAGPDGEDLPVRAGVHQPLDALLGAVEQPGQVAAGIIVLGVGVGIGGKDGKYLLFDESEGPPRGGVIGIEHVPDAEGSPEGRVAADDLSADEIQVSLLDHGAGIIQILASKAYSRGTNAIYSLNDQCFT